MGDNVKDNTKLSPEASDELVAEMAEPGADTAERRGMFDRMERLEMRLKADGFDFDDEPLFQLPSRR